MAELMDILGDWTWWVIAGVLLLSELLVMNIVLVWFGLAALTVAIIALAYDMSWQIQIVLFVALSIAYLFAGRRFVHLGASDDDDNPHLNKRIKAFMDRVVTLDEAIVNGEGVVRIDDSQWRVRGDDMPAGTKVRITDADGMILKVEKA